MTPHLTPPMEPFTLREAAQHAGVSISTIRRRKNALLAAGAFVSPAGWAIPQTALDAVFATPNERAHDTPPGTLFDTPTDSPLVAQLRSENDFLRHQVEQQARTIERQAEAHAIISAQLARLGQLETTSHPTPPAAAKRCWWQR